LSRLLIEGIGVVKAGITDEELYTTIQAALKLGMDSPTPIPSISKRLNHLGRAKTLPPKRLTKTAADYYSGNSLVTILQLFNQCWLRKLKKNNY